MPAGQSTVTSLPLANVTGQASTGLASTPSGPTLAPPTNPNPHASSATTPTGVSATQTNPLVPKLLTFDPSSHKTKWMSIVLIRFLLIALWIIALVFGGTSFFVYIDQKNILGYEVDVDTQLAFLGIFNKVMDVLVLTSLEDLTSIFVLGWMLNGGGRNVRNVFGESFGARLGDFEIFEEISKPWHAIGAFWSRCVTSGWTLGSCLRLVVMLGISLCVLLQGLAINTLGIPKERWFPDEPVAIKTKVSHPSMQLHRIDIASWNNGWHIVGNGRYSWDAAGAYSLAAAYVNFEDVSPQFSNPEREWKRIGSDEDSVIAMDTRYNGSYPVRGFAVQSNVARDLFQWLQANGTSDARSSNGWMADVQMVAPMVTVQCSDNTSRTTRNGETVTVDQTGTNSSSFQLWTASVSAENLDGTAFNPVLCDITLSRAVFPINAYVKDHGSTRIKIDPINDLGSTGNDTKLLTEPIDIHLADQVRIQMIVLTSRMEDFVSNLNAAQLLAHNARWMRSPSIRNDITSDAAAVAPAIALFCTHVLAHAAWEYTLDDKAMLQSSPVRWQIYAAGPRLQWEWIAAVILSVLVVVHLVALLQSVTWGASSPEFMKPGGMLIAANSSDKLDSLHQLNRGTKALERETFYLRKLDQDRVSVVQHSDRYKGDSVDIRTRLKWSG